ncbi:hypothetical protein TNCV_970471 [Trichonephila clavipes]|nr:hypothetical protein TNCV_970471 [Trichonephila clavipes]
MLEGTFSSKLKRALQMRNLVITQVLEVLEVSKEKQLKGVPCTVGNYGSLKGRTTLGGVESRAVNTQGIIPLLSWTSEDMKLLVIGVQLEVGLIAKNNSTLAHEIPDRKCPAPLQTRLVVCNGEDHWDC